MTCSVCAREACGCCAGIQKETPQPIDNRPGLPAVRYRIGRYAEFRASLHAALSSSKFPALAGTRDDGGFTLAGLQTRDDGDFTIGLIDAFACAADVLTFYQERLIQESFLGTAVERVSLQELGKLVGYRLRPGVAAETWLAFALETPPAPPPSAAPEPGSFVSGVPTRVSLASGLRVDSVPGPGEKPQTFETVEALPDARPGWNAMRPAQLQPGRPRPGHTFAYVAGVDHNLRVGDGLLFVGRQFPDDLNRRAWEFRPIQSVTIELAARRTLVRFARPLPSDVDSRLDGAEMVVLRRRAAFFGHNAPAWLGMTDAIRLGYGIRFNSNLDEHGDWPFELDATPDAPDIVDLDAVYPDVTRGSYVVLARGAFDHAGDTPPDTVVELYTVDSVTEASRADFALSGKVTRLGLRGLRFQEFRGKVRETSVFAASERLPFADYPLEAQVLSERVPVVAAAEGLLPGRRLIVRGTRARDGAEAAYPVTLLEVASDSGGHLELAVTPPLTEPLVRASVVVFGNVALASHGETVSEVLGSGNAGASFQRFELAQRPLTHRAAPTDVGVKSELVVRVSDVAWEQGPTLFGAGARDQRYALETDEQGRDFVTFGDGVRGARLTSGSNNVRAVYRMGLGTEGNVGPDKLTQLSSRPLGLKTVTNPLAAEGGTDPESVETARRSIPLGTRTLGRAVSLLDYEDFARTFAGIAKAQAGVLNLPHGRTLAVSIVGPGGARLTESSPVWRNLLAALRANGDPNVELRLLAAEVSMFRLGLRVRCDGRHESNQVLSRVEAALRSHYSFEARELSAPIYESDVVATAQGVPGVVAVDLTALYGGTEPEEQTRDSQQRRLLATRMRVESRLPRPAELLTLDPEPFDLLETMP
jgi:predicted phage baseplate assembly protein